MPEVPSPTEEEPAAIVTTGLTRRFGSLVAVDHLDLTVARATIFGLLGSNGAGKTTTIRMLTTLLRPDEGEAVVAGLELKKSAREIRRRVGYVPQLVSADSSLTGRENLTLSGKLYGIPRRERKDRVAEALHFMNLDEWSDELARHYSGGMIRRLEIAQALLHRPMVLFLDEPTVGLDPMARQVVWERLGELRARTGTTVLLTTHDMAEADALCQVVAIMQRGRVVAQGAPAELKAQIGKEATLSDVFLKHTGGPLDSGGRYRDVARTRRTAKRLG